MSDTPGPCRRRRGRRRGRRARTTSRPSSGPDWPTACRSSLPTCPAGRSSPRRSSSGNGAVDEPDGEGGATVLAARALTEGTEQLRRDRARRGERAARARRSTPRRAGTRCRSASMSRRRASSPRSSCSPRSSSHPTFPEAEVDRLRDERLNDLLQAEADPRRRADEAFAATIYTGGSPYRRPSGGTQETVERLDAARLRAAYQRGLDPARATLVVGGDLDRHRHRRRSPTGCSAAGARRSAPDRAASIVAESAVRERFVRVLHRPGSVQTEIRIGHVGLPRRIPDFHALSVMGAILGGLFNSRLNAKLREEKGYTYGAGAGFDLRRAAGPFAARAAVNTEVTVPAILDIAGGARAHPLGAGHRCGAQGGPRLPRRRLPAPVRDRRRRSSGRSPGWRFTTCPDDELARYRPAIEAVTIEAVQAAAGGPLRPDQSAHRARRRRRRVRGGARGGRVWAVSSSSATRGPAGRRSRRRRPGGAGARRRGIDRADRGRGDTRRAEPQRDAGADD